ncbi:MAG: hypothetical protein BGO98_27485 [Myxococcales bacterium 68-20]|nr:serine/threonine protein kinase [Myxococcales bacterium]OJY30464.1 MAG: hypothetical protein BGO98_27485 [Myxococcales bacterium 68-20]
MGSPTSIPTTRRSGRLENEEAPATVREPPAGLPRIDELVAGRYRVERLVGSGGMAHVLAARHIELGHAVAMKVLDPSLESDVDAKERFAREARAMAALSSKHTVRVHDVGALATGLPFMVMELLEGKDLSQLLAERGPLPFDEACSYIDQACEAVEEAHDAGLIHRDLKPQNLFLATVHGGPPILRVLDFGIARAVGGRIGKLQTITRMGDLVGTLSYMAPEQIKSSRSVDERTDIWALGACLYRLVAGKHPFVASPEAALVAAILGDPPTPITQHRPDVPAVLASVILRCLRKTPEERFPTARSLRSALAEARAIMAVEPFMETTEPSLRIDADALPARERVRVESSVDPGPAHVAREAGDRAPTTRRDAPPARVAAGTDGKTHGTTEPMAHATRPDLPIARRQATGATLASASNVGAAAPSFAGELGPAIAPRVEPRAQPIAHQLASTSKPKQGGLVLILLIVLGVAALVVLGGSFVLLSG